MQKDHAEAGNSEKILRWICENQPIGEKTVTIRHDMWCASMYQHPCNCSPDLYVDETLVSYPRRIIA